MCEVLNQTITIYSNGESVIELDSVLRATKIHEIQGFPEGGNKKIVINSVVDELGDKLSSVKLTSKTVEEDGRGTVVPVTVGAAKEERVHVIKLKIALHLNVSNKIFLIITTYD